MQMVQIPRRNPFDYTQRVSHPKDCVGRTTEIKQVEKCLQAGRICEVIGGAKIGKTSFLSSLAELGFPIAIVSCRQIADEVRKSVTLNVASMLWVRVTEELAKATIELQEVLEARQQQVEVQYERIASELKALSRVFRDTEVFRPVELHKVGERLAVLRPDEHILLAFDDFDELLSRDIMGGATLAGVLDSLLTLYEASGHKVWLVFTSTVELTELLVERRKGMDEETKARFDRPFNDFQRYLAPPVVLKTLSEQEIKALGRRVPGFPPYASREIYRESGGHPFLAQALYYYAYLNNDEGDPLIAWGEVLKQAGQDGLVVGFLRGLSGQLSRAEHELLRIAMGTASNAQKSAIRYGRRRGKGQLPQSFSWRPFVPKRLPWGRANTNMVMKNLVSDPSLMGLLFRKATDEEQQGKRPYLIQVGDGPRQYVASARFVWRAFRKGIPKRPIRRWWAYSDIKLLRLSITLLFVILLLMLALSWVNVPSQLALILSIVPLIYWLYGYIVERHGRDENAIR